VTAAIIEAGRWIDASLANKNKMAETIADKSYVNTSVDAINQRILGATRTAWARPGTTRTT
jgi:nitrate/nitrite transport system substrate-binding protein